MVRNIIRCTKLRQNFELKVNIKFIKIFSFYCLLQFRTAKGKTFFKDKVKKLMRQKKNDQLKYLIENEETYPKLNDSTGTTLLHLAAKYGNVELMQYSIESGCEINAKDSFGTTPLMIATKNIRCKAMKLLLHADADIFTTNLSNEYSLQLVFQRNNDVYPRVIKLFYAKVKSRSSSVEEAAEILLTAGCSLDHAVSIQDSELLRIFLNKEDRFDDPTIRNSISLSMFMLDSINLKILLTCGSTTNQRIEAFLYNLYCLTCTEKFQKKQIRYYGQSKTLEIARLFASKIIDWKLLDPADDSHLSYIKKIFEKATANILQEILESGIVSYVQNQFNYSVLPYAYGNQNEGVFELLRDKGFESEALWSIGSDGVTALHIAACRSLPNNVKYLLDIGVDPNVVDDRGDTPLMHVLNSSAVAERLIECINHLLNANANVQIYNKYGSSFMESIPFDNMDISEPILAHLAMLDVTGVSIKQTILAFINKIGNLKNRYETLKQQLEKMKIGKVDGSFSLMTVLTSEPEKIARYVGVNIEKIIATFERDNDYRELSLYYSTKFKNQLDRALKINELRCKAYYLIIENIECLKGYDPVVHQIISNFDFEELLVLVK